MIILVSGIHLKFLCDTRTLEVLGLWTVHLLVHDVLEFVFSCLSYLSTLIVHFNILKSSLAVQFSKVSIFCCFVGIASIRLLRCVLMDVPLVNFFISVVDWQYYTLALMKSKDITEIVVLNC
jgi:hypothetical protein